MRYDITTARAHAYTRRNGTVLTMGRRDTPSSERRTMRRRVLARSCRSTVTLVAGERSAEKVRTDLWLDRDRVPETGSRRVQHR